ncbi:MAG TPA: isochorismate synthase, partial [Candidatus Binatia bacterium]|nr:isochorismate synthase [Candidatus Binatia bacterium]
PEAEPVLPPDLGTRLADELARLGRRAKPGALLVAAVPIDPVDAIGLVGRALAARESVAAWLQPAGRIIVGVGTAAEIALDGPDRFAEAARIWQGLAGRAVVGGPAAAATGATEATAATGAAGAGPILVGGATFAPGRSADPCWRGFETGWLRLPRLLVTRSDGVWLATAALLLDEAADLEAAMAELENLVGRIGLAGPALGPHRTAEAVETALPLLRRVGGQPDRRTWEAAVARAAGAVSRGRIDKLVLARRVDVAAAAPIDVPATLRRLTATAPTATIFALSPSASPERVFLGASPERLVEVRGRRFRTIALAGTIGRGQDAAEDDRLAAALLASEKDREEHAVVVAMLRSTLEPVSESVEVGRGPEIVRLRTVMHLATPIAGRLRDGEEILGLVERLHPTPAVGGWPREAALALLGEEEELDRGWYAGPVGWLDTAGDGEFVVGIRSGVVEGARASLFAGCGIVADSEPDREWEESELKLAALAGALGRFEEADD